MKWLKNALRKWLEVPENPRVDTNELALSMATVLVKTSSGKSLLEEGVAKVLELQPTKNPYSTAGRGTSPLLDEAIKGVLKDWSGWDLKEYERVATKGAEAIAENAFKYVKSEEFLDSVVDRILRKQIPR